MSIETRITALAQAIGADIKAASDSRGVLTGLTTTAKNSLVSAINELKAAVDSTGSGDVTNADLTTAIDNLRTELRGGAGAALDTFDELAAAINDDATFAATLATTLSTKANSLDIGNFDRDFTNDYITARDA